MNSGNIDEIVKLMVLAQKNERMNIDSPQYNSSYLNLFFEDTKENGTPTHTDAFISTVIERLCSQGVKDEEIESTLEKFQHTWNNWVTLYRQLNERGLLKD